jgi:hypothetical protein
MKDKTMHPDQKTLDALNAPKAFEEYPKMLYHPDGRQVTVASEAEEKALPSEWQQTPDDAAELKAARDKIGSTIKTAKEPTGDDTEDKGKGKSK